MVTIYHRPFFCRVGGRWLLVDEVTAKSVAATAIFCESMASFGLVGAIGFHIDSQLFGSVGELALLSVGAETLLCEISAERALGFGRDDSENVCRDGG